VPASYGGNIFFSGLSYLVAHSLPGGIRNVTWSMNVAMDQPNVSVDWKWTAGVYTSFAGNAGVNVKPVDGILNILNPLVSAANAGTPLNYVLSIVPGAMGAGLLNITNTYSASASIVCSNLARGLLVNVNQPVMPVIKGSSSSIVEQASPIIEEASTNQRLDIKIIPNPSTTYFNVVITGTDKAPVSIEIVDMLGRVIEKSQRLTANTVLRVGESWKGGVYFARVIQGDHEKFIKMIKTN
jgi:hypothetical protein